MQIKFLEVAQIELDESVEYYNSEHAGLGDEFLIEVLHALERINHCNDLGGRPAISFVACVPCAGIRE